MVQNLTPSSPYADFLAELEEIRRHKWFMSEKEGADVGFDRALMDWVGNHRLVWRKKRNDQMGEKVS